MTAVDLSPRGLAERKAADTLRDRAERQEASARRCQRFSNEQRGKLREARHLRACAALIESEHGHELGDAILDRGWRALADACTQLAAKLKADDAIRRAQEANPIARALEGVKR